MPHQSYYELCDLVAPGWSVHEGDAHPQADGPFSLTAPDYEEVIWRTWCHFFEYFSLQDDDVYIWPERPPDWLDRIARASTIWDESQAAARQVLMGTLLGIVDDEQPPTGTMSFGAAIVALQRGGKIRRKGFKRNVWVELETRPNEPTRFVLVSPNTRARWRASHASMLASDWLVTKTPEGATDETNIRECR